MKILDKLLFGVLLACMAGMVCIGIFVVYTAITTGEIGSMSQQQDRQQSEGRRAYDLGVPAQANPYKSETGSRNWLEGWMQQAEQRKQRGKE